MTEIQTEAAFRADMARLAELAQQILGHHEPNALAQLAERDGRIFLEPAVGEPEP